MPYSLDISGLLGLPFAPGQDASTGATDCMGLVRAVLAQNGRTDAAATISYDPLESERIAERILAGELPEWEVVGSSESQATQLLDVLMGPNRSGGLHVAILVSTRPRLVLSTFGGQVSACHRPSRYPFCRTVLRCPEL